MHVAAKVGIAAATAGAAGFGMYKVIDGGSDRVERDKVALDKQVAEQGEAWDTWSAKYEAAFPGGRLDTPADHARLDQFLRDNPAPSWVKVDHADFTKARLSVSGDVVDPDVLPIAELGKGIGYMGVGAVGGLLMGAAFAIGGFKGAAASSALGNLGALVGGTAMAASGVAMLAGIPAMAREGRNDDGYVALMERVRSEMA